MTTVSQAGFNTLLGMGTVFVVLILMSFIIYCFRLIPFITGIFSKNEKDEKMPLEEAFAAEKAPQDDLEIVAVITAAIAAAQKTSADSFVVRNIKRRN